MHRPFRSGQACRSNRPLRDLPNQEWDTLELIPPESNRTPCIRTNLGYLIRVRFA